MQASQWLYVLRPVRAEMLTTGPTADEQAAISRHAEHVSQLAERGVMIMVGRTQTTTPDTIGLAVFMAEDEPAARTVMDSDPAVQSGVMTAELFPYRIAFGNAARFKEALEQD